MLSEEPWGPADGTGGWAAGRVVPANAYRPNTGQIVRIYLLLRQGGTRPSGFVAYTYPELPGWRLHFFGSARKARWEKLWRRRDQQRIHIMTDAELDRCIRQRHFCKMAELRLAHLLMTGEMAQNQLTRDGLPWWVEIAPR